MVLFWLLLLLVAVVAPEPYWHGGQHAANKSQPKKTHNIRPQSAPKSSGRMFASRVPCTISTKLHHHWDTPLTRSIWAQKISEGSLKVKALGFRLLRKHPRQGHWSASPTFEYLWLPCTVSAYLGSHLIALDHTCLIFTPCAMESVPTSQLVMVQNGNHPKLLLTAYSLPLHQNDCSRGKHRYCKQNV